MEINTIQVNLSSFQVIFADQWDQLQEFIGNDRCIYLIDQQVFDYWPDRFEGFDYLLVRPGESSKSLEVLQDLLEKLITLEADRNTLLIAVGGGMVCDLSGFLASIYMRGCRIAYVPSTLLAMVDAAYGGKTGINFKRWKNLLGTFRQPEFIFNEISFLQSLPHREFKAGLAEAIKHCVIGDADRFNWLENNLDAILQQNQSDLKDFIRHSVNYKLSLVKQDEKENGIRRILNFGHTFGHAIERNNLYNHGESVALGMILAARISEKHCDFNPMDTERLIKILDRIGLPVKANFDPDLLMANMALDKKKAADQIYFIFLDRIGNAFAEKITPEKLAYYLKDIL